MAKPYGYKAVNGDVVIWTPMYAMTGDDLQLMEETPREHMYRADVAGNVGDTVTVYYVATVTVSAEMAQKLGNEAYDAAVEAFLQTL